MHTIFASFVDNNRFSLPFLFEDFVLGKQKRSYEFLTYFILLFILVKKIAKLCQVRDLNHVLEGNLNNGSKLYTHVL